MKQNHSQEIRTNEFKLLLRAAKRRFLTSLALGAAGFGAAFVFIAPKNLMANIIDCIWFRLVIEFRKLPLLGVRHQDIHLYAKAYSLMISQMWFWYIALALFAGTFILVFSTLNVFAYLRAGKGKLGDYKRGSKLLTVKQHNRLIQRSYGANPPLEMGSKLLLGQEKLMVPESLQYRHFAFVGASGYGKSTAIEEILIHARSNQQKVLVVDLNGAFYSKFGTAKDKIISLHDSRSEAWDFWNEPFMNPETMASAIIEEDSVGQQFFFKAGREVLASLFRINSSLKELIEDLERPQPELKLRLQEKGELALKVLGEGSGDQADGVMGTAVLDLAFVKALVKMNAGRESFSIGRWMHDDTDPSWVFLTCTDASLESSKAALRLWFETASIAALSRSTANPNSPHTWLVVDEVKSIGRLPSLPSVLDKGRKHKSSIVLGFQAFSQIKRVYGEHDANAIFQGLQNQFFFRMTDVECAKYASDVLGEQEVDQVTVGLSFGDSDKSERGSLNQNLVRRKIVLPEEIRNQDILRAYAKLCHHQPVSVSFRASNRPEVNIPFCKLETQPQPLFEGDCGVYSLIKR
jgi:hypothetical protein